MPPVNGVALTVFLEYAQRQQTIRDLEANIIQRRRYIRQLEEALRFNQSELLALQSELDRLKAIEV